MNLVTAIRATVFVVAPAGAFSAYAEGHPWSYGKHGGPNEWGGLDQVPMNARPTQPLNGRAVEATRDRVRAVIAGGASNAVARRTEHMTRSGSRWRQGRIVAALCAVLAGCASEPLVPFSTETPPLMLVPAAQAGVQDKRGRFREIYCAVLAARVGEVPDHRPCEDALTRVGAEPAGNGQPVASRRVEPASGRCGGAGHRLRLLREVAGAARARSPSTSQVRLRPESASRSMRCPARPTTRARSATAVMAMDAGPGAPRLVLIGYSKGAPDILDAIVNYPEIRARVAAVVSIAGAVGGSPLANDAEQYQADMLRHFPGAACDAGDGGGVASLRPAARRAWLAQNPLPADVPTTRSSTFPQPERISSMLKRQRPQAGPHRRAQRQPDDLLRPGDPGSDLLGYLNADHWAVVVPIARSHDTIGIAVRHPERLSARSADRGGASLRRGGSCRARQVAIRCRNLTRPHALAAALIAAGLVVPRRARACVGLPRAPRHRCARGRASSTPSARRSSIGSGPKRASATSSACARRRRHAAGRDAGVHRLGRDRPRSPATIRARAAACSTARSRPTGSCQVADVAAQLKVDLRGSSSRRRPE